MLKNMGFVLGSDFESFAAYFTGVSRCVAHFDVLVQDRQTGVEIVAETTSEVPAVLHVHAADMAEQPRTVRKDFSAILAGKILRR